MFTIFTVTFQKRKFYNSNYLFYIGNYQKKTFVKPLQHKYAQI